jgi:hypothetical protein
LICLIKKKAHYLPFVHTRMWGPLLEWTIPDTSTAVFSLAQFRLSIGTGEGNRTLVVSLEGCCSAIALHLRQENEWSDVA